MRNNNPIRLKTILFSGFFLTLFAAVVGMTQGYSFGSIFIAGGTVTAGTTAFVGVRRGLQWLGGSGNHKSHSSYYEDAYDATMWQIHMLILHLVTIGQKLRNL